MKVNYEKLHQIGSCFGGILKFWGECHPKKTASLFSHDLLRVHFGLQYQHPSTSKMGRGTVVSIEVPLTKSHPQPTRDPWFLRNQKKCRQFRIKFRFSVCNRMGFYKIRYTSLNLLDYWIFIHHKWIPFWYCRSTYLPCKLPHGCSAFGNRKGARKLQKFLTTRKRQNIQTYNQTGYFSNKIHQEGSCLMRVKISRWIIRKTSSCENGFCWETATNKSCNI